MAFKPPVKAEQPYSLHYVSDLTSGGATLLRLLWVPKSGGQVPEPEHAAVAAGESATFTGKVPSAFACRWLEIWVDLPDGSGSGRLTLSIDGTAHSTEQLTKDALWTSIVLP